MSTRKKAAAPVAARQPFTPLDFAADFARQQLSVVNEANCALFRGFEAMREIQQQAAHDAAVRHEAAAQQLRNPGAPMEFASLQASLLQEDLQDAGRYWRDLTGAALEMQLEIMASASHLVDSEAAIESVSALEAFDALPGVAALFGRTQPQAH